MEETTKGSRGRPRGRSDPWNTGAPVRRPAANDLPKYRTGTLSEGDLLKLEPGQENLLKDAHENTLVTMRVMTSKGEEGEVKAGALISVAAKDLQDFDSEFRAKLDLGLAEAEKNRDQFKKGAL